MEQKISQINRDSNLGEGNQETENGININIIVLLMFEFTLLLLMKSYSVGYVMINLGV